MGPPYAEVIGDPIAHSKSPLIHKFWLEQIGLAGDYRRTHVRLDELAPFLAERRADPDWRGCNVTIPHKQSVIPHVDATSPVVSRLGAVNCITRQGGTDAPLIGGNTDWSGFLEPLQPWLQRGEQPGFGYVLGAGGAAAAVSYALDHAGFTVVSVARDRAKVLALRHRLGLSDDALAIALDSFRSRGAAGTLDGNSRRLDVLVNTTPLGMGGFPPLDIDLGGLPVTTIVYDIVYDPLETPLLAQARRRGMPTLDGLQMLVGQAAEAFELFFARPAPRTHDNKLRALLIA
jgi:shikimate dehydrogenase